MQRTRMMGLATALALTSLLTLVTPNVTHAQNATLDAASTAQASHMDVSPLPWVDAVSVVAVMEVAQAQELVHTLFPYSVFSPEPEFLLHRGVWVYEFVGTEGTFLLDAVTGAVLDDASRAPADPHDVLPCSDTEGTCDSAAQIDWYNVDCHNDKFMCAFTIAPPCSQTECMGTDPAVHPCPTDACNVDTRPSELSSECAPDGSAAFTCVVPDDCSVIVCDVRPAYPVDESTPFLCGMLREDGTVGCPDSNDASLPAIDPCATEACQAVPEPVDLDTECARTPDGTFTCVAPVDCSLVVCDAADAIPASEAMAFPRDIPAADSSPLVIELPIHPVGPLGIDGTFPDVASADMP